MMASFQPNVSSSSEGTSDDGDRWSTTKLQDSLPTSIHSSLSTRSRSSNTAENLTSVTLAFAEILLPELRSLISQVMEDYLHRYRWSSFKKDPIKKTALNFPHSSHSASIVTRHQLAFLFLQTKDQHFSDIKSFNLDDCGDIRILLKILIRAGCFLDNETEFARNLKDLRNQLAHEDLFTREYMKKVFDEMISFFEAAEANHKVDMSYCLRKIKQLRKFGAEMYLKKNHKCEQLSSLKSSIMGSSSEEAIFLESLIDATIIDISQEEEDNVLKSNEIAQSWMTMKAEELDCHQIIYKTKRKNDANLESLLTSKRERTSKISFVGKNFKMSREKFAQGSSRIAFRGHFDGAQIFEWFAQNPEVVLKKSKKATKNTPFILEKIRYYTSVLVTEFNLLKPVVNEKKKIKLLDLLVVSDRDMTMEPYIDHTRYVKW